MSSVVGRPRTLREKAAEIWGRFRRGQGLDPADRANMIDAYWAHDLPDDPNYDLYQWVEDGMPDLP